jgi:hypothetical protein
MYLGKVNKLSSLPVAVINSLTVEILMILESLNQKLIIIDNADLLLMHSPEIVDYIVNDKNNNYLIMSKYLLDFKTYLHQVSELVLYDKTFKLISDANSFTRIYRC